MRLYRVSISEAAETDIRHAFEWYEEQRPGLGDDFRDQFMEAVSDIRNGPLRTQVRYGQTRVMFLQRFPFGIHFIVKDVQVVIVACFHTAQDPQNWQSR